MNRAYLDHASSAPLRPAVLDAMLPYLRDHPADPGRLHAEGRVTRVALEDAREQVAAFLGARPREVVLTSSGTESVNAAIWGALARADGGHVVTTAVEHSCVRDAIERAGAACTVVGVDHAGRFEAAEVLDAFRPDTVLVSTQLANHEVGTLQPAAAVGAAARERGVLAHVDACAAAGRVPIDFGALGADLCSVTTHKWGGPKGAGALLVRRGLRVPPLLVGGAQERARRGGIEDVPAWVGFGAACTTSTSTAKPRSALSRLRPDARPSRVERFGDASAKDHSPLALHRRRRCRSRTILLALDQHGSRCTPVRRVLGDARTVAVLRRWASTPITPARLGRMVDHRGPTSIRFVEVLPGIVERFRELRTA